MRRIRTKARMISILMAIARGERSTVESIATPCSVNAYGGFRIPPQLEVANCDFKLSHSTASNRNMKSEGNRPLFLFTASSSRLGSTAYNRARSGLRSTRSPRIDRIRSGISSSSSRFAFILQDGTVCRIHTTIWNGLSELPYHSYAGTAQRGAVAGSAEELESHLTSRTEERETGT